MVMKKGDVSSSDSVMSSDLQSEEEEEEEENASCDVFSEDGCSGDGTNDETNHRAAERKWYNTITANRESRAVLTLRLAVVVVLLASTAIVSYMAYDYITRSERNQFETQFINDSNKIFDAIGKSLDKTLGAFDSLAVTLISSAKAAHEEWPFVTLPDFGIRMSKVLPFSDAVVIYILPIVTPTQRSEWETYTLWHDDWVNASMTVQATWADGYHGPIGYEWERPGFIHGTYGNIPQNVSRLLLPQWQTFPSIPMNFSPYNWDWLSTSETQGVSTCLDTHQTVLGPAYMLPTPDDPVLQAETEDYALFFRDFLPPDENPMEPVSDIHYPIVNDISRVKVAGDEGYNPNDHTMVGIIAASIYWRSMIRNILPNDSDGVVVVVHNPCNDPFTYQINGPMVEYLGPGDHHEVKYESLVRVQNLADLGEFGVRPSAYSGAPLHHETCPFTIHIYPSDNMYRMHTTNDPYIFMISAIAIFAFTSLVFFFYDRMSERRQAAVMKTAERSTAIVSSLFPVNVRERLYAGETTQSHETATGRIQAFLRDNKNSGRSNDVIKDEITDLSGCPIAELYPDTTVMFADIVGFTAWSSIRQPTQVFHLLETIYCAFDKIARKRNIFKVETIGDSYVAVVGLPNPRKHHAVAMVRFAQDCRNKMVQLTIELEKTLGPGTASLALRIGLNSGPTTAGVLRGEKARFQLFGDTVNTAARMESTGERNRIQVSQKTAELIRDSGKGHWLSARADKVHAKGKGIMQTFWCNPKHSTAKTCESSERSVTETETDCMSTAPDANKAQLVNWNVEMLHGLLRRIAASRESMSRKKALDRQRSFAWNTGKTTNTGVPRDEFKEMSLFTTTKGTNKLNPSSVSAVQLNSAAVSQLREYVTAIADLYHDRPFHNFDHCSHVAMSTKKLLDRIADRRAVASQDEDGETDIDSFVSNICSDPLTTFAIVFAALIHDVDHPGVSNAQLVQEGTEIAKVYKGESVAEQNSIDIAWNLLMEDRFVNLRTCIYSDDEEKHQFRQILVHVVLATDLFDADLKALRESRWDKSFHHESADSSTTKSSPRSSIRTEDWQCRASIILELIIQVSDVCHTMQHFTVYKTWNMRLLKEMYVAYQNGRAAKDPTVNWYEGELWFFDNYVIPLGQKLRECGVFGVSCDEFLDYAKDNRLEWEMKGRDIVQEAMAGLLAAK